MRNGIFVLLAAVLFGLSPSCAVKDLLGATRPATGSFTSVMIRNLREEAPAAAPALPARALADQRSG